MHSPSVVPLGASSLRRQPLIASAAMRNPSSARRQLLVVFGAAAVLLPWWLSTKTFSADAAPAKRERVEKKAAPKTAHEQPAQVEAQPIEAAAAPMRAPEGQPSDDPIRYAVVGPEGGVPTHKGRFKSPFAHPEFGEAAQVQVGLMLANVREYEIKQGTFQADFFLSLTSNKAMPKMNLIFPNGHAEVAEAIADEPTFKLYRYIGKFSAPVDLHHYPFDTQELTIEVEDDDNGIDQIRFIPDLEHTNVDAGFDVAGWETAYMRARSLTHYFPDRFENDDLYYPRYVFRLGLRRYSTNALFTVFFPAIVIVLISLTGLWLPREVVDVRSNATTPMLAAAVLFHFALIQSLPATAYLTRADKLMLSVYAILLFHMVITWVWFVFHERHTERIFRYGKLIGLPVTFLGLAAGMFL